MKTTMMMLFFAFGSWGAFAQTTQSKKISDAQTAASVKEVVVNYLQVKNALVKDNGSDAAAGGNAMVASLGKIDKSKLTTSQKKVYEGIEAHAREQAEHIGRSAAKIEHQREHFDALSADVYELVKIADAGQRLYKDFCPMYNDGKGAIWLSETKDIKNPYYGASMSTCGSVKEEIK